jgi:hypothetical protein
MVHNSLSVILVFVVSFVATMLCGLNWLNQCFKLGYIQFPQRLFQINLVGFENGLVGVKFKQPKRMSRVAYLQDAVQFHILGVAIARCKWVL